MYFAEKPNVPAVFEPPDGILQVGGKEVIKCIPSKDAPDTEGATCTIVLDNMGTDLISISSDKKQIQPPGKHETYPKEGETNVTCTCTTEPPGTGENSPAKLTVKVLPAPTTPGKTFQLLSSFWVTYVSLLIELSR
ncbi:hypothetical protein CRM22_010262 [Opisthorchis felineus]|uniref:Immunoglobulin I-set domain-containing protein n=1 Tax=Opisthorchis felineus TaxID=147828 RepID=A0A4S2L666_OPIFE|nr:hypothetical protein CRM22_010262 [Opisthorchis felineus]